MKSWAVVALAIVISVGIEIAGGLVADLCDLFITTSRLVSNEMDCDRTVCSLGDVLFFGSHHQRIARDVAPDERDAARRDSDRIGWGGVCLLAANR